MVVHVPDSWEVDVGGSEVRGYSWLYVKLEASLGYIKRKIKIKHKFEEVKNFQTIER